MHRAGQRHQIVRRDLLAALLLGACAAPALGALSELPPIAAPPTQEHLVGKVIFRELVTPDLTRAKQFYGGLLGWTFRDLNIGEMAYAEALLGNRSVGGLLQKSVPAGEHRQPA
jgi:hypothetical protein